MKLAFVTLPKPENPPICYVSHFGTQIHETRGMEALVDFPIGFGKTERKWVPLEWVRDVD